MSPDRKHVLASTMPHPIPVPIPISEKQYQAEANVQGMNREKLPASNPEMIKASHDGPSSEYIVGSRCSKFIIIKIWARFAPKRSIALKRAIGGE